MAGESRASVSGSGPDRAAGVWTQQLNNPGRRRAVQHSERCHSTIVRALADYR